ncbi:MAG: hypothetical protein IJT94_04200 [Oscillibacter sp.]|nr:hypothetical protein [Oscillibacter sp.]
MKKRKVYDLFMADEGQDHTEAWAKLELPASPYEIRDALEKAQISPGRPAYLEIQRYLPGMEWLKPFVAPERELTALYAFNALAEKLAAMDALELRNYEERVRAESDAEAVPLPRLYDLAVGEGAFQRLDLTPVEPDYIVLMECRRDGAERTAAVKLPAPKEAIEAWKAESGETAVWQCADCLIPRLANEITAVGSLDDANDAAVMMQAIPKKRLPLYKALLEAKGVTSLREALNLYSRMEEYGLAPRIRCVEDAAKWELRFLMDESEAEKLIPHVNLRTYGEAVMAKYHMTLTGYGGVSPLADRPAFQEEAERQKIKQAETNRQETDVKS